MLLGQRQRPAEGERCLRQAIDVAGGVALYHYNLALLLQAQRRPDEAAEAYRSATQLKPDYAEAHYNLGLILQAAGNLEAALASLRAAVAQRPDLIAARYSLADVLVRAGRLAEAASTYLGLIRRRPSEAVFWSDLCRLFDAARNRADAATIFADVFTPGFRDLLAAALADGRMDRQALAPLTAVLIKAEPGFSQLGESLADRLLLAALEHTILADSAIEQTLTRLRGEALKVIAADACPPWLERFVLALARQCFNTEYVYAETTAERALAAQLASQLGTSGDKAPVAAMAILACYAPLHRYIFAAGLRERPPENLGDLVRQQILEPEAERSIAATITALTPLADGVSAAVRQQYEENPYPRWFSIAPPETYQGAGPGPTKILVAGCGTGQQSIAAALRFPSADVLAIDLSRASLAYAIRRTRELGIRNIRYAQADILRLHEIDEQFDVIECAGVLHHLRDPLAGWRQLVGRLRGAGIMGIGLYSTIARRSIVEARRFIASRGYPASADGIRRCRGDIMALPDDDPVAQVRWSPDFFSLSGCRDLLFHVEENTLTLPAIKAALAALDLEFLEFQIDAFAGARFRQRFPQPGAARDLDLWHAFETENPETFAGMYRFWAARRAA